MDLVILSITKQDPLPSEEALIDRDFDVFDTIITVSPISMSRANLSNHVGRQICFLEAIQASIVPYVIEVSFHFPKFIGWCEEQYSQEEKVIMNKQRFKALYRVESLSIQDSLSIPKSFFVASEPFDEENIIRVYRECPSEVRDLFL